MLEGIDISHHQKNNYKTLIDQATDFVIVRAAWRMTIDEICDPAYQYAKSKGKKLGFYFFPLTGDGKATDHAKWAVEHTKGYIGEAIPILDWESYQGTDDSNTKWALDWLNTFYDLTGVRPLIYMNFYCNQNRNWSQVVAGDYGLWLASYGTNNGQDQGCPSPKYWQFAAMHQYTSNPIDKDKFFGSKAAWDLYAKSSKVISSDKDQEIKDLEEKLIKLEAENRTLTADYQAIKQRLTDIDKVIHS